MHSAKPVADKHIRQSQLFLQFPQEVQDLRLHGNVQGGNRFIQDNHIRIERKSPCNADSLALSAGKSVRIPVFHFHRQSDHLQQFVHAPVHLLPVPDPVIQHGFPQDVLYPLARIERGPAVLKHHLESRAHPAQLAFRHSIHAHALEEHFAGGRFFQADHQSGQCGFSAARLSDNAEGFSLPHRKRDILHGMKGFGDQTVFSGDTVIL